ncbi:MAG: YkgJ family cysteine cluster protein [Candidatus Woesearchaeota archaeon]
MDAEYLAQQARKSLSKFCAEECSSYCCRTGNLVLSEKEFRLITKHNQANTIKKLANGKYCLEMTADQPCPCLDKNKCLIHGNPSRPVMCRQFPIFLHNKTIYLSTRCPAVKKGLLFPFVKRLMLLGYKEHIPSSIDEEIFYLP